MKFAKLSVAAGFFIGIVGFLLIALAGERELGKLVFLIGFFLVAAGLVLLVLLGQRSGSRGTGLRIAAGGFLAGVIGGLINFVTPSIGSVGDIVFDIGIVMMLGGILFHLVVVARSKNNPDF